MIIIPCSCQCLSKEQGEENLDQSKTMTLNSESSSSSNCSLSPQQSLPSIPSLSPPSQLSCETSSFNTHCLATLKAHSSYVFSLSLSGKHLYSGSSDGQLRLWSHDSARNQENMTNNVVAEGSSAVKCIVITGDKLFSAHQDHKIRVWRINNSTPDDKLNYILTLPTVNDRWVSLFSEKNYVTERKHKKYKWVQHIDTVSSLALSQDGSLLYSASWDRTFKIWRISDFKCLESVQDAHEDAINAIVVSSDGFVYTGSADRKIKVWKRYEGEKRHMLVATLEKHKSGINALALSSDGLVLYSGACDRSIVVWERDSGEHMVVAGALRGHSKAILCLVVVADIVVSGSADTTVRIWRSGVGNSYGCLGVLEGHTKPVKCLASVVDSCNRESDGFGSGGGKYCLVYSGSLDCDIKMWRIRVGCE